MNLLYVHYLQKCLQIIIQGSGNSEIPEVNPFNPLPTANSRVQYEAWRDTEVSYELCMPPSQVNG